MTDNITQAKTQADTLSALGIMHPAHNSHALRGILHALLAIHEQNAKPTPAPRKTTPKESK